MQNSNAKPSACAAPRLILISATALLFSACSTLPGAAPAEMVCSLQRPEAALMQSLPNGALTASYQGLMQSVDAAIDAQQITAGQLLEIQHAAATRLAELGDESGRRLIALQDWATRALKRCGG